MDRDLTTTEFQRYHDLIYKIAGIHYPSEKLELLSNRIRKRIRAIGETSYDSYLMRIGLASGKQEMQAFLDSITTNETYFFRCQRHWDYFKDWLIERKKDPELAQRGLRIWSAAASNGAEACTMLIVLHQVFGDGFGGVPVEVLGTDLSTEILAQAEEAVFRPYALAQTPKAYVHSYFEKGPKGDEYRFDRALLRHVKFRQHNLMQRLPQPGVAGRVAAAHSRGDGDLLDQLAEDFSALGVRRAFFMLDRTPFIMAAHLLFSFLYNPRAIRVSFA